MRRESRLYADVIVADFVDAYRRLSLKSLFGLVWARRHCRAARFIVKVDDDVYLRPDLLPQVHQLRRVHSFVYYSVCYLCVLYLRCVLVPCFVCIAHVR